MSSEAPADDAASAGATSDDAAVVRAGIDAVALKPATCDVRRARDLPLSDVVVDYEGHEHVPATAHLAELARHKAVRVTTPVRADGYDPLGDDSLLRELPEDVGRVLVAGNPAYLTDEERRRAIAPRLGAARELDPDAWVGTESVERLALAAGGTQFELLGRSTAGDVRALRAAGYDGEVAVYAPTVLSDDDDAVLDAVGSYVARRRPVREALPEGAATDSAATGRARRVLVSACSDYALTGDTETVAETVAELRAAGVDRVVGYPARGLDEFRR